MGVDCPGRHTPPMIEYPSSSGIWRRFIANRSFRGAKASAGRELVLTAFSRRGFRCRRISDSETCFLTTRSTSELSCFREYSSELRRVPQIIILRLSSLEASVLARFSQRIRRLSPTPRLSSQAQELDSFLQELSAPV